MFRQEVILSVAVSSALLALGGWAFVCPNTWWMSSPKLRDCRGSSAEIAREVIRAVGAGMVFSGLLILVAGYYLLWWPD